MIQNITATTFYRIFSTNITNTNGTQSTVFREKMYYDTQEYHGGFLRTG